MSTKRVIVGQSSWAVGDRDVDTVLADIRTAMEGSSIAQLPLYDSDGRPVTVYVNGRTVQTVVVDLDGDGRPGEIS
jgi:hypothetical protein